MFVSALCRLAVVVGFLVFMGGCAGKESLPRFVWPPPPEKPRMEFIGNYNSESSFKKTRAGEWLSKVTGDQVGSIFRSPFGIASDSKGIVYISDVHMDNVRIFDFNNKKVEMLVKGSVFKSPMGLDVDSKGNLYIADADMRKVFVYGPDRRQLRVIGGPDLLKRPSYLAVNEQLGRIYVTDGQAQQIVVFDLEGNHLFNFGSGGIEPGQFVAPQGLDFNQEGKLFIADSLNARIQVFDAEGQHLYSFGERGDQVYQFENPKDLSFDSEGNLWIVEGRRSEVHTYTPEGRVLLVTGAGRATAQPFGFAAPRAVFVDAHDRVYVAENLGRRFSVWQYMTPAYLENNPYTKVDEQQLVDYMRKVKQEKDAAEKE